LLDASRPERERLQALFELGNSGGFVQDGETLAAVIDLGTRSQSADTRAMAWGLLRRMAFDPAVAPALSASLLSDPDPGVRREAALALGAYRGDNSYQQTLAYASRNDSSLDVRIAAQISMMDREQQRTFARERLLDRDLTPAERLGPTALLSREPRSDPSASLTAGNIQMPDALALAEIVSLTDDPALKVRGLAELQRTFSATAVRSGGRPTPEITRVMIDSTKNEEISVRRQALSALLPLSDDPEVRAVLESVVANEPELAARVRIPEALARVQ
jgi:HEAT repeat protein